MAEKIRKSGVRYFLHTVEASCAYVHHEIIFNSLDFFQKLCTISFTLNEQWFFTKHANLVPFQEILANSIKNICYKFSICSFLE